MKRLEEACSYLIIHEFSTSSFSVYVHIQSIGFNIVIVLYFDFTLLVGKMTFFETEMEYTFENIFRVWSKSQESIWNWAFYKKFIFHLVHTFRANTKYLLHFSLTPER